MRLGGGISLRDLCDEGVVVGSSYRTVALVTAGL